MLRYPVRRFFCVAAYLLALALLVLAWALWNVPNEHSYAHDSRAALAAPMLAPLLYLIGCFFALRQSVSYPNFVGVAGLLNLYPIYLLVTHGPLIKLCAGAVLAAWALGLLEAWEIQRRIAREASPMSAPEERGVDPEKAKE